MENNGNWQQIVAEKDARIAELEVLVKFYEEQFRLSKSKIFGASSEKGILPEQLGLFDEAKNAADSNIQKLDLEQITYARRKRVGKREDDLSVLPVEIILHKLSAEDRICPECSGSLHEMGHDVRRELKIIPAQVKVVEHNRAVYSCRNCEKNNDHVPIIKTPTPEPVIRGSLASPSAVAHIMTQKYVMHIPLYRQEQSWKRQGVALSRQTMASWVIRCAQDWLAPLYERMRIELLKHNVLHGDESVLQVLKEPGKAPTTNSYMWLYRTSGNTMRHVILFEYQPSRSSVHPKQFLKGFKGLLHADGYAGYHTLPPEITVIGCWTHLRRKFSNALKAVPEEQRPNSIAHEALLKIGYLFHLETTWKNLIPEERHRRRLQESKPLAEQFFEWLEKLKILPKSIPGRAIHYALEQRPWLMNVYINGQTELSNNRIENSVRPFAVGRKNWLFCDTVNGANASAVVYSVIETAIANGLKPFEYLEFLFETIPNTTTGALDSLLPWGDALPERCRMPVNGGGNQHAEKKRGKVHDSVCTGLLGRGA